MKPLCSSVSLSDMQEEMNQISSKPMRGFMLAHRQLHKPVMIFFGILPPLLHVAWYFTNVWRIPTSANLDWSFFNNRMWNVWLLHRSEARWTLTEACAEVYSGCTQQDAAFAQLLLRNSLVCPDLHTHELCSWFTKERGDLKKVRKHSGRACKPSRSSHLTYRDTFSCICLEASAHICLKDRGWSRKPQNKSSDSSVWHGEAFLWWGGGREPLPSALSTFTFKLFMAHKSPKRGPETAFWTLKTALFNL